MHLVSDFIPVFSDVPSTTNVVCHDVEAVDVQYTTPCKQHPYQLNPIAIRDYSERDRLYAGKWHY